VHPQCSAGQWFVVYRSALPFPIPRFPCRAPSTAIGAQRRLMARSTRYGALCATPPHKPATPHTHPGGAQNQINRPASEATTAVPSPRPPPARPLSLSTPPPPPHRPPAAGPPVAASCQWPVASGPRAAGRGPWATTTTKYKTQDTSSSDPKREKRGGLLFWALGRLPPASFSSAMGPAGCWRFLSCSSWGMGYMALFLRAHEARRRREAAVIGKTPVVCGALNSP
jgi:hypothetical protein